MGCGLAEIDHTHIHYRIRQNEFPNLIGLEIIGDKGPYWLGSPQHILLFGSHTDHEASGDTLPRWVSVNLRKQPNSCKNSLFVFNAYFTMPRECDTNKICCSVFKK